MGDKTIASTATSGKITLTPAADSWVSAYSVKNDAGTALVAEGTNLPGRRTIELSNIVTTGGVNVTVAFSKQETINIPVGPGVVVNPTDIFTTSRNAGSLSWMQTDADNKISYREALTYNFNAKASNYMLGSKFGNSATFGVNPLTDPKVTMVSNFTDAATYKNATPTDIAGKSQAVENYSFKFGVDTAKLVPGTYKQTVESDYYTASYVCPNHWYHAYGTTFHKDGLTREITIDTDTLALTLNNNGNTTPYTYGQVNLVPTLTPGSNGVTGSQAQVDPNKVTYTYSGTLEAGGAYGTPNVAPTMPGTYTITASYTGDAYIRAYTGAQVLTADYTIIKAPGADATLPTISDVGTDDITLSEDSIIDGQEYTIDGSTWMTAAALKNNNCKFGSLESAHKYTIQTRMAETTTNETGVAKSMKFTYTKLAVSGTVSSTDGTAATGTDLPAAVTLTNADGASFVVQTNADGTYNATLLASDSGSFTYNVSAIGKDGYKEAAVASVPFTDVMTTKDITMILTAKGQALENANEFIDSEITPAGGTPITEVNKETVEKILTSEADWGTLNDAEKADVNEILSRIAGRSINYTDIINQAHDLITNERNAFVTSYLTGQNTDGTPYIYTGVESGNLDQILAGVDDWATMTPTMKAAINAKLADNGTVPSTYDELIQAAKDMAATNGTQFIKDNLTLTDGTTVITSVNDDNYAQILASEENWNKLSQAEKDEVNKQLQAINPNCTYEGMLAQAKNKTTFETYRGTQVTDVTAKHVKGESAEKKAIIDAAQKAIKGYQYDYTKTPEENQKALDAIIKKLTADLATQTQKEADQAAGESFVKKYLTDTDGEIFTEVTADNYKKILSGEDAWKKLTAAEKAVVNAMLKEAGADPDNYPAMLKAAKVEKQKAADQATANKFVKKYLTDKKGKIFTKVTDNNYEKIVSGMDDWNKLTKAEKAAVNAMLKEAKADPDNYPEMLKEALATQQAAADQAVADDFVKKYLTGTDGKIFTGVTAENYAQIISGSDAWNKLTDTQKAAVNAILKNAKATPDNYPDMLKAAQIMKAALALPKTGDASAITWYLLILAFGCVAVITTRKKAMK